MSRIVFRRSCLALSALALTASSFSFAAFAADAPPEPILGTPEQDEAERLVLELAEHPDVKAIQAGLRDQLRETKIGQTKDGAATIDHVVECMTNSLIFMEVLTYRTTPYFVWGTEDTPREWRGRRVGCVGTAGDNPDNVYRTTSLQGGVRYEVTGKFDPSRRATQFIVQAGPGEGSIPPNMATAGSEVVEVLGAFSDRELDIAPDGSFRLTIGGDTGATNHIVTPPGRVSVGFRDTLGDWNQRPARLSLRRLDPGEPMPFDRDELRRRVVGRLGDYVRSWSQYATYGFGGLEPNTHSTPTGRAGGWGFVMGVRFSLQEDEAVALTLSRGEAKYLGFQVVDPWTMAADATKYQTSLNLAQATPDRDGNYTYIISPTDPGVANWLDTTGLHDGFGIVRWQATPADETSEGLVRSFRIIKLADAARLPGIAKITPTQRQAQLEKRAREWAKRLH
ncbi:MAG: hypothetical protein R3E09_04095 [Novosphingobium sp.]|nr:hypothetical protein [Novosphingobium sp.]